MQYGQDLRFIADVMLGRLARWLRFLGYDTLYDAGAEDAALVRAAQRENRILLTRDRALLERWRPRTGLFVAGEDPLVQLREVVSRLSLTSPGAREPRCTSCNVPLIPVARREVRERVPRYVYRTRKSFSRCEACGRIYWEGTHVARMREDLARTFSAISRGGGPSGGASA